ncbi:MAG: hypothetical protein OXN17_12835 [Candidatus Poribacteria bacterium]|nr:hypothetical protein [Candidatus Poribacteria bacterium]MDE0502605.1 hypothetical protein [Candidatus Poribacteria bacterium]
MKIAVAGIIALAIFWLDSDTPEFTRWGLHEGAKLRIGKGRIYDIEYSPWTA